MIKHLFILIIAILLLACSPQQRLARLTRQHPELIRDTTLVVRDTIYREHTQKDTVFKLSNVHPEQAKDTIYTVISVATGTARASLKAVSNTDEYILSVENTPDTIYIEKDITVSTIQQNIIQAKQLKDWQIGMIAIGLMAILLIFLIILRFIITSARIG